MSQSKIYWLMIPMTIKHPLIEEIFSGKEGQAILSYLIKKSFFNTFSPNL